MAGRKTNGRWHHGSLTRNEDNLEFLNGEVSRVSTIKVTLEHDISLLEKEYKQKLENIEQEARQKIQEAANLGTTLARDIQERARIDAQKMIDRAQAEIEQDLAKAKLTLRDQIVEISSLITEKILKEKIDHKEHTRLVDQFISEIEKV